MVWEDMWEYNGGVIVHSEKVLEQSKDWGILS